MHDVIVIGAGPAGMAAGIYAAANKLKTLILAKELSASPADSFELLQPEDLAKQFKKLLKSEKEYLEFLDKTEAVNLEKNVVSFSVEISSGAVFYSRAVILAVGKGRANLENITLKDAFGRVKINAKMQTNVQGLFAAGEDASSGEGFVLAAAGEGAKAAQSAIEYLKK